MSEAHTHTRTHTCIPHMSGPVGCCGGAGSVCRLAIEGRGKRAKGTCWHNAFTNNYLLLLVSRGEHFMEMAVYEGQRGEKAAGEISFLDSPTSS